MADGNDKIDRLPPQDLDAERSVLGAILIDKEGFFRVADLLEPSDFYQEGHRKIFDVMTELTERSLPLDVLTVASRLREKKQLDQIGGQSYLTQLVNAVPSSSNITYYGSLVHKKSMLRRLISASYNIAQMGYNENEDVDVLLDSAEREVFKISERSNTQAFSALKNSLGEAFDRIDRLHKNTGELRGVPTGFSDLDNVLAGLQKSDLIILAARPSLGKSSLALDIARNAAINHKIPTGIFSLEMSQDQIVDRFIAAQADIDLWRLRTGKLANEDFPRIQTALGELSEAPIFVDDGLTSSVLQMRAMARRLQAEHGLGLLIVDYLQLIQPKNSNNDNLVQQVSEISRALKSLARELNIPVLAVSQLSRAVEQRHPQIPRLSDLRDSGSIEQDADVVLFIYRDLTNRDDPEAGNVAEIHIAKHRNGPTGKIDLAFHKKSATFASLERYHNAPSAEMSLPGGNEDFGIEDIPS
ncbi:MAG: replicative DNA helicase [Candidatus Spechtbacterales bacterium]